MQTILFYMFFRYLISKYSKNMYNKNINRGYNITAILFREDQLCG